jgi:hypothetical protein
VLRKTKHAFFINFSAFGYHTKMHISKPFICACQLFKNLKDLSKIMTFCLFLGLFKPTALTHPLFVGVALFFALFSA